jgi:hypothetical protein
MKKQLDGDVTRALVELGVVRPERHNLEGIASGNRTSVCLDSKKLGRCYERATWLTLNAESESDVPTGNGGNAWVLATGEHPLLGRWIKSSCDYDSSD